MLLHAHALIQITPKHYHKPKPTTCNTNIKVSYPIVQKSTFLDFRSRGHFRDWGLVEGLTSGCDVTSGAMESHFRCTGESLPVVMSLLVTWSLPVDWGVTSGREVTSGCAVTSGGLGSHFWWGHVG